MSKLDFEFEQVLGTWLDHCAESLSLQKQLSFSNEDEEEKEQDVATTDNNDAATAATTTSSSSKTKTNEKTEETLLIHQVEKQAQLREQRFEQQQAHWMKSTKTSIERFRSMIVDNMEKLREMFRVILFRLKQDHPSISQIVSSKKNLLDNDENDNNDENNDDDNNANPISYLVTSWSEEIIQQMRQKQFAWMIFDCFIQTVPLVACQWCWNLPKVSNFVDLVEKQLPWEFSVTWCDSVVSQWLPLFANVDKFFSDRVSEVARQQRMKVTVAQNMAAEEASKKRYENATASHRNASNKEMEVLNGFTERLLSLLQKHKPNDGRTQIVKLESDLFSSMQNQQQQIKQEMTLQFQQAAAQLANIGNTGDAALDVDVEYEPDFIPASMKTIKFEKDGDDIMITGSKPGWNQQQQQQRQKNTSAAAASSNQNQNQNQQQQGGRKEPRKRPR